MRDAGKDNAIRLVLHLLVWGILLVLPVYTARSFRLGSNFLLLYFSSLLINGLLFYVNYLFLVPGFFFRKKRLIYALSLVIFLILFFYLSEGCNNLVLKYLVSAKPDGYRSLIPFPPGGMRVKLPFVGPHVVSYLTSYFFVIFLSLGIRVLERQFRLENLQEEAEKAKLNAELVVLKNQISPHFFFNTLNNIYALIGKNNDDSKNAVIKLSKLMRYVLNESGKDFRLLADEVEFMNNYIDLMRLRIGHKTKLFVQFPTEYHGQMVPHLLFISLIENAFKYGISVQEDSVIDIRLTLDNTQLNFRCENSLPESIQDSAQSSSGIGLDNLKKRLGLLYPQKHKLEILKGMDNFQVSLTLVL